MAKNIRPPKRLILQPPLVPVIDVVFNLLIFFMCIPNAAAGAGYLTTNLPKNEGPNAGIQKALVERIKIILESADGNGEGVFIALNDTQTMGDNFEQLGAALQGFRNQGLPADHPVLLAPTMEVKLRYIVNAFDECIAARFTNIQFQVPTYSKD